MSWLKHSFHKFYSNMWIKLLLLSVWCCLGAFVLAADYELRLEDPDVFSDCKEPPPGAASLNGLFNTDELQLALDGDTVHISGNVTTVWDIQPNDRISASARIMQWDRGVWQPTVFSIATNDFCKIMYDKDQYWYKYWTRFVTNSGEVEGNCITNMGTKLVHEPFDLIMVFHNIRGATLHGRYKVIVTLDAFDDHKNIKRQNNICIEILGDFEQL